MTIYKTLDDAMNALRASVDSMDATISDVRLSMGDRRKHNVRLANAILQRERYSDEPLSKLEQWGIVDAQTDAQVEQIIYEVIDYRRDASLHHCN